MSVPTFMLLESVLHTVHKQGHPRAGKRVQTYVALRLERVDPKHGPIYQVASRWHEEDPDKAMQEAVAAMAEEASR